LQTLPERESSCALFSWYDGGMVLNHLAAIFFFSGPLFYIGLVIAAFPSTIAWVPEFIVHRSGNAINLAEENFRYRRIRRTLRLAGFGLVVVGVLLGMIT
jgi:hypothetical protein